MPELPEVETMRRGILPIVGSRVVGVEKMPCARKAILISPRIDAFLRRVIGKTIADVERAGKRVVIRLETDDRIVLEPRMTGLVLVTDPPSREHLRFRIRIHGGFIRDVYFWDRRGLGSVRLLTPAQFAVECGRSKLGLDALEITAEQLRERLRHSARAIKVALLDQKAVAGIGNLYASEILHRAGIHPAKPCHRLRKEQWQRILAEMLAVLHDAIAHQGSTLRDGTYRIARDEPGNYQFSHRVYQRHGKLCVACGRTRIVRIVQAQRSTFYCPKCQRK